jgi:hypothetical protein
MEVKAAVVAVVVPGLVGLLLIFVLVLLVLESGEFGFGPFSELLLFKEVVVVEVVEVEVAVEECGRLLASSGLLLEVFVFAVEATSLSSQF